MLLPGRTQCPLLTARRGRRSVAGGIGEPPTGGCSEPARTAPRTVPAGHHLRGIDEDGSGGTRSRARRGRRRGPHRPMLEDASSPTRHGITSLVPCERLRANRHSENRRLVSAAQRSVRRRVTAAPGASFGTSGALSASAFRVKPSVPIVARRGMPAAESSSQCSPACGSARGPGRAVIVSHPSIRASDGEPCIPLSDHRPSGLATASARPGPMATTLCG